MAASKSSNKSKDKKDKNAKPKDDKTQKNNSKLADLTEVIQFIVDNEKGIINASKGLKRVIKEIISVASSIDYSQVEKMNEFVMGMDTLSSILHSLLNSFDAREAIQQTKQFLNETKTVFSDLVLIVNSLADELLVSIARFVEVLKKFDGASIIRIIVLKQVTVELINIIKYLLSEQASLRDFVLLLRFVIGSFVAMPIFDKSFHRQLSLLTRTIRRLFNSLLSIAFTMSSHVPLILGLLRKVSLADLNIIKDYIFNLVILITQLIEANKGMGGMAKNVKIALKQVKLSLGYIFKFLEDLTEDTDLFEAGERILNSFVGSAIFASLNMFLKNMMTVFDIIMKYSYDQWKVLGKLVKAVIKTYKQVEKFIGKVVKFGKKEAFAVFKIIIAAAVAKFFITKDSIQAIIDLIQFIIKHEEILGQYEKIKNIAKGIITFIGAINDIRAQFWLFGNIMPKELTMTAKIFLIILAVRENIYNMMSLVRDVGRFGNYISALVSTILVVKTVSKVVDSMRKLTFVLIQLGNEVSWKDALKLAELTVKLLPLMLSLELLLQIITTLSKFKVSNIITMPLRIKILKKVTGNLHELVVVLISSTLPWKDVLKLTLLIVQYAVVGASLFALYQLVELIQRAKMTWIVTVPIHRWAINTSLCSIKSIIDHASSLVSGEMFKKVLWMVLLIPVFALLSRVMDALYDFIEDLSEFSIVDMLIVIPLKIWLLKKTISRVDTLLTKFSEFGMNISFGGIVGMIMAVVKLIMAKKLLDKFQSIYEVIDSFGVIGLLLFSWKTEKIGSLVGKLDFLLELILNMHTMQEYGLGQLIMAMIKIKILRWIVGTLPPIFSIFKRIFKIINKTKEISQKQMSVISKNIDNIVMIVEMIKDKFSFMTPQYIKVLIGKMLKLLYLFWLYNAVMLTITVMTVIGLITMVFITILYGTVKIIVKMLTKIIGELNKIDDKEMSKAIAKLVILFKGLSQILDAIASMKKHIILIIFLVTLGPIIMLFLAVVSKIIIWMVKKLVVLVIAIIDMINKIKDEDLKKAIAKMITILGAIFLILQSLKEMIPVIKVVAPLVLLILVITVILTAYLLMIAAFGLVVKWAGKLLTYALIGCVVMIVFTLSMLLIFTLIMLISMIELDRDRILENVRTVLSIVDEIVKWVMSPLQGDTIKNLNNNEHAEETRTWGQALGNFAGGFGRMIARIVMTLGAAITVVLALFAVVSILVMAGMLRLLQEIYLDRERIIGNVELIFDVIGKIVHRVFFNEDDKGELTEDSWVAWAITILVPVLAGLAVFFPGIGTILAASVLFSFLGLSVISVLFIFMIAAVLRGLQEINLEYDAIIQRVDEVLDTCSFIVDHLLFGEGSLNKRGEDIQKSDQGKSGLVERGLRALGGLIGVVNLIIDAAAAILAVAYLLPFMLAVLCLWGIGAMLNSIANMTIDTGKVIANARKIMLTCAQLVEIVLFPRLTQKKEEKNDEEGGFWSKVGSFLKDGLSTIWDGAKDFAEIFTAILAIGKLAILMVTIGLLWALSKMVASIGEIDQQALANAVKVAQITMSSCLQIVQEVFEKPKEKPIEEQKYGKGLWKFIKSNESGFLGINRMWQGFEFEAASAAGGFAQALMATFLLKYLIDALRNNVLNVGEGFTTQLAGVPAIAQQVMTAARGILDNIFNPEVRMQNLKRNAGYHGFMTSVMDFLSSDEEVSRDQLMDVTKSVVTGAKSLKLMSNAIGELGGAKVPTNIEDITEKISSAASNIQATIKALDFSSDYKKLSQHVEIFERLSELIPGLTHVSTTDVKNSKDLTENYTKFLTRVNSMDMKKLETTEKLMAHWASISRTINGNFQGLAEAINQNIMPAIENLNHTMEGVSETQQNIITELQKPIEIMETPAALYYKKDGDKFIQVDNTGTAISNGTSWASEDEAKAAGATEYSAASTGGPTFDPSLEENTSEKAFNEYDFGMDNNQFRPDSNNALSRCIEGDALRVKIVN